MTGPFAELAGMCLSAAFCLIFVAGLLSVLATTLDAAMSSRRALAGAAEAVGIVGGVCAVIAVLFARAST